MLCFQLIASAQSASDSYPRFLTTAGQREALLHTIAHEEWAGELFERLQQRTDVYVARVEQQSDWLTSRLAMYWKSHATQVYVRGESFERVGGESAPEPTVRYTGTRGIYATHGRPKLEEVVPYDDDEQSYVTFCNKGIEGEPMEKVHPAKTGRNIESLNNEIVGIARDAAFLYWVTQREAYARLAAGVFDTYMAGIYYRNVPIDLNHGHQQTLVGMSSFEVIHEDILNQLVPLYDFLHDYLAEHYAQRMPLYAAAFKKWAENIIDNGVPHNNWNLMQARFVMNIALILDEDEAYPDGKGRSYYIDYVVNRSSIRQWSLKQLAAYGYDEQTGIWAECPGYTGVVLNDYANFTWLFDHNLRRDLTAELPVIPKAVMATMQYLFPNRMICGFGDTHPSYLKTAPLVRMIQHAHVHGKREMEDSFTALLKCLDPKAGAQQQAGADSQKGAQQQVAKPRVAVTSFFEDKPLQLKPEVKAGAIERYVSPLFHADNVSWLVQRNGMDAKHSLMASLNGSQGNHMHANGISLELYGKGYVLGPDAGIGQYLYSGLDYAEYYSQFPAHNTVCVDGISAYPVMKSNHVLYEDVFCRNSDDCTTVYATRKGFHGGCRDITMRRAVLWADVAHPIMIGLHGDPEANEVMEELTYEDIDILDHSEMQIDYQGCIAINVGDNNLVRRVRFENIRIEDFRRGQLFNLRIFYNKKYCAAPGRGIEDILFKNIAYNGQGEELSMLIGYNEERKVQNIRFEGLRINGQLITDDMPGKSKWYKTGDMARIFIGEHVEGVTFTE